MKFTRIPALILAAGLLFSGCAHHSQAEPPAVPQQGATLPQKVPAKVPEKDPYQAFLAEKAYLTGEELPYGPPTGFCRKDLDGDGKDELLLVSAAATGFGSFWVYTAPEGKVVGVPVDAEYVPQFFGAVKYSPAENALVFTEVRPSLNAGGYGFWQMADGALEIVSAVTWDEDRAGQVMYTHRKDGKNISITAEERDNLLAEPHELEFTPIP